MSRVRKTGRWDVGPPELPPADPTTTNFDPPPPPSPNCLQDKDKDKDNDKDKDKDTEKVPETPNLCYIFEILMTHSFQI